MITSQAYYKNLILSLSILSTTIISSVSQANTFGDIDIGVINDDNLTRSDYNSDKKAGTALELFADYGKFYDLNNNLSATSSLFVQYTSHFDYDKLSTFGFGVSGSLRKKLGLGAYSSSVQSILSITANNVNDSKRDNKTLDLSLGWNKRLNDMWELSAGVSLDNSDATNKVFDTSGTSIYFSSDYTISEKLLLNFGVSQRSGDIISVTSTSNPNYTYISLASGTNNISDKVFGSGLTAYRVNATTLILKTSLSYALNDDSSFNVGYEHQNSSLAYGIDYKNNIIRANYIYIF